VWGKREARLDSIKLHRYVVNKITAEAKLGEQLRQKLNKRRGHGVKNTRTGCAPRRTETYSGDGTCVAK